MGMFSMRKNLPPLHKGDILLHGHTHVPKCVAHENYIYMNPGSVSIPKENSYHGYMTLGRIGFFSGKILKEVFEVKLLFKQRLFSWFDSYDIYDETEQTVYVVKGQLAWGHCLKIFQCLR